MEGKLSVIIPTWSGTTALFEMAYALAKTVRPMCDELVITEDGEYYEEFKALADIYLHHSRMGHGENLKLGFQATSGDFVAILDSDIVIKKGTLRDLCLTGRVVTPVPYQSWGWFFVSPRRLIEEYPPFDLPGPEGIDHWWRAFQEKVKNVLVHSDKVEYTHLQNRSYDELQRQQRQQIAEYDNLHPRKEIDPQRHKARLQEDPLYAKIWGNEEAGQA